MSRTATRRRWGIVIAFTCAAMLTACTGNADDGGGSGESVPVVAPDVAATTAGTVLGKAVAALADTSATGATARDAVFTGVALENANAWAKVLPNRTAAQRADAELSATGAKVIGVSRIDDGPQQILVQTTLKKSGAAVLVLLIGDQDGATTDGASFKVAAVAPMLEDSRLDPLDPASIGSQAVTADTAAGVGLAQDPDDVVQAFADSVRFPKPTKASVLAADALTAQLQKSAQAEANALKATGAFTQVHEPKGILGGLRLLDSRGAVVFAQVLRTDGIAMRGPVKLTPSKDFTLLTGVKIITTEASLRTNEIIAFVIPASGQARIIASSDQLVGGTGR